MSVPVIELNSSPAVCSELRCPPDAQESFPGLALAYAGNSGIVLMGNEGATARSSGARCVCTTKEKSFNES